ncbi:Low temperature viability protein [Phellopilus nigrolimitatus]|nr:Low temperature viability protein [Phellopilus nigrolimitatus]
MAPKSIFRQPGARHFQLVHRSQRDPLIHDPEASQHVLKAVSKGQTRADLERALAPAELAAHAARANIGAAAAHGVYFDDTAYDYMQHLREVGLREDGVVGVLVEASSSTRGKGKARAHADEGLDLPPEALPSRAERTREEVYGAQAAVPPALAGLQPDMDPHLRQALEALEDDAFVDDALDEGFFGALVGAGERGSGDEDEGGFAFVEGGAESDWEDEDAEDADGWEARFAKFKKARGAAAMREGPPASDAGSDDRSEGVDTVGGLPSFSVIGGKKRRKGASDASGYSMSSSSMFRNKGLTLLDERFDQVEKEYESEEEEEELSDDEDGAPELITSREDFNDIMDDFLDNYEILGGKMRHVLPGETVTDKLGTIRRSLKEIGYDAHGQLEEGADGEDDDGFERLEEAKGDRWDCETILSTYSNLENHPRLIRARETKSVPKIYLDPKTGLPSVKPAKDEKRSTANVANGDVSETIQPARVTVARPKNESKDEKHARKQAVKEGRQARRVEKKATKDQFFNEKKHLLQVLANTPKRGIRKL